MFQIIFIIHTCVFFSSEKVGHGSHLAHLLIFWRVGLDMGLVNKWSTTLSYKSLLTDLTWKSYNWLAEGWCCLGILVSSTQYWLPYLVFVTESWQGYKTSLHSCCFFIFIFTSIPVSLFVFMPVSVFIFWWSIYSSLLFSMSFTYLFFGLITDSPRMGWCFYSGLSVISGKKTLSIIKFVEFCCYYYFFNLIFICLLTLF